MGLVSDIASTGLRLGDVLARGAENQGAIRAQQLQQQNMKKQLDDLKSKAKIEIVGAPSAAASGASAASATK